MLNKTSFTKIETYLKEEDKQREDILARSRTVVKSSKAAIYSIHRSELDAAAKLISDAQSTLKDLKETVKRYPHLAYNLDSAFQEFTEAVCFYEFMKRKNIPTHENLDIDPMNYLAGLSDLTGELARKAVISATAKDKKAVAQIRDLIDEVYGQFIKFDLRNSELRKKSDSIKWNLQKVEELLYDLSLKE